MPLYEYLDSFLPNFERHWKSEEMFAIATQNIELNAEYRDVRSALLRRKGNKNGRLCRARRDWNGTHRKRAREVHTKHTVFKCILCVCLRVCVYLVTLPGSAQHFMCLAVYFFCAGRIFGCMLRAN